MSLDIDSGCKMALKHLRDPFPAIYLSIHFLNSSDHFKKFEFWAKIVIFAILTDF